MAMKPMIPSRPTPPPAAPALGPSRDTKIEVGNALSILRPTLGQDAGIGLYRLLRLVALEDIIGRGAPGLAYIAGKKLGVGLKLASLDDFLALCASLKIGTKVLLTKQL